MSNFHVPKGYRERERRGIERSKRRAGGVSDEIRAQRQALIAQIDAQAVEAVEPVEQVIDDSGETEEQAPAETVETDAPAEAVEGEANVEGAPAEAVEPKPHGRAKKAKG